MSEALDNIAAARTRLSMLGPFPQGIWFVDRDDLYDAFTRSLPIVFALDQAGPFLRGLPVHGNDSSYLRTWIYDQHELDGWSMERIRDFVPFCQPGVWVKMSDGHHRKIEVK